MRSFRYFKPEEFQACTPSCSIEDMNEDFLQRLDDARNICGVPFHLNSAFRSREYEIAHDRHLLGIGSHSKGLAVDIRCTNSQDRLKMVLSLLSVGFRRIGIYPTFIHVDSDLDKIPSIWLG